MSYGQRIYDQAIRDGMPSVLAQLIVGQAGHETAGFTSHVFLSCLNAFGYKWIGQTTADGSCTSATDGGSFAQYSSIEDSTHELTQWIRRRQLQGVFPSNLSSITTAAQYAALLNNAGFFGSGSLDVYANGIAYWYSKIPLVTKAAGVSVAVLAVAALVYVNRKRLFGKKISSIFD